MLDSSQFMRRIVIDCSRGRRQDAGDREWGEDGLIVEGMLVAWIESGGNGQAVAAFVGETRDNPRTPARRAFDTAAEARGWVEQEAGQLSLPVKWLPHAV